MNGAEEIAFPYRRSPPNKCKRSDGTRKSHFGNHYNANCFRQKIISECLNYWFKNLLGNKIFT